MSHTLKDLETQGLIPVAKNFFSLMITCRSHSKKEGILTGHGINKLGPTILGNSFTFMVCKIVIEELHYKTIDLSPFTSIWFTLRKQVGLRSPILVFSRGLFSLVIYKTCFATTPKPHTYF